MPLRCWRTTEEHAGVVANDRKHLASVHAYAIEDFRMTDDFKTIVGLRAVIKPGKNLKQPRNRAQAGDDHLLPRDNRGGGAQAGVDCNVGRCVAGGLVFYQCLLQQCINAAALPIHASSFKSSGTGLLFHL
jgi:hypothetical protein